MNWETLQENVVAIVKDLNEKQVPFKEYALTYAENILAAIDEGYCMGMDTRSSAKIQLTYVISNLDGADREDLDRISSLAEEFDIDLSGIIKEMLEEEYLEEEE
jgi:hypothetical protein